MAARGYTTEEKIENYILNNIDSSFSTQLASWIEAVEKYIEHYTGRIFIADTTASARLFDGDGTPELLIDECTTISKVEVGEDDYGAAFTEVAATGADRYFTDPANASALGLPVYKITLRSRNFPEGKQNNRVTAKWGYSTATPADIEFAATVFVAGILNQHRGGGDKVVSERIGNYTVTYDANDSDALADFKRALEILDRYKILNI